uniref:GTD-binding domain-containing protein n=1 Tax=Solanum lycopersicum TaxID=4081 RepID=A0A3Q7IU51_SOLLC
MAESYTSQLDVASLKETLCAQQQLLQKLYNELDEEREASSSAASEALSMIVRLQGEKAAVKMEAEQYKRLAEEKMCHAEESLDIFEDLFNQKEMEIAALEYQVQAYRYKLLSTGCADPGVGEFKYPDNLLQRNETLAGEMNPQALGRRNSAPHFPLKFPKKGALEIDDSSLERESNSKTVDEYTGQEMNEQQSDTAKKTDISRTESINSCWQQIRKLDDRVKEITGVSYANLRSETRSPSPLSQRSMKISKSENEMYQPKLHVSKSETGTPSDSGCSPNVLDVFEVPRAEKDTVDIGLPPKHDRKMVLHNDERLERPDSVQQEAVKSSVKDEAELLKKYFVAAQREKKLRRASEAASISCHLAISRPTTSISGTNELHLHNRTSEIGEVGREATRQEMAREELKLLHEIKEQLNLMHSEIQRLKTDKLPPIDESSLLPLSEPLHVKLLPSSMKPRALLLECSSTIGSISVNS